MIKFRPIAIASSIAVLCLSAAPSFSQSNNGGANNSNFGGTNNSNFGGTNNSNFGGTNNSGFNNSNFGGTNNSNFPAFGPPPPGGVTPSDVTPAYLQSLQDRLNAAEAARKAEVSSQPRDDSDLYLRQSTPMQKTQAQLDLEKIQAEIDELNNRKKDKGSIIVNRSW